MIVVAELCKAFSDLQHGAITALDHVSFECRPGEVFGLLGPNGAGKTTTLRILSTVLKPTAGSATVAGFDVVDESAEVRKRIGFLSNNTGLYDRMDAWEHVEYFGRLYGLDDDTLHRRMEEVFRSLQMNGFRDLLVSKMSTGMRQKVSIARTIIHDPPVLIFDEPTMGLDVLVAREVLKTVERLRHEGKCIIYSTHIMSEVEKLCQRMAVIHHGRILGQGECAELLDRFDAPNIEELFFRLVEGCTTPAA